jgi:hypothetical protein
MNPDFEKQLQRQPIRQIPREWRAPILDAASRSEPPSLVAVVREWLWPHPRAWAGLAAAWVVIFLLQFTAPEPPRVARSSTPVTIQTMATLREQSLRMAQLLGQWDNPAAPAAAPAPPKPRSERPRQQIAA